MNPKKPSGVSSDAPIDDRHPCKGRRQHPVAASAEACREQHRRERNVPRQPVVRVQLTERVDGFPLALVGRVRHRPFEHRDEAEGRSGEKRAAERDRAVAAVAVALRESSPQTGPEEDEKERDERCHQECDDLVLAPVVLPIGERLRWPCLAGRIVPEQNEADEEQQPRQHTGNRQEAVESVGNHAVPLV